MKTNPNQQVLRERARGPSDYNHIKAYGLKFRMDHRYIRKQMQLAFSEGAPIDAVFKSLLGTWMTYLNKDGTSPGYLDKELERIRDENL